MRSREDSAAGAPSDEDEDEDEGIGIKRWSTPPDPTIDVR
jgi:hypothetical protein